MTLIEIIEKSGWPALWKKLISGGIFATDSDGNDALTVGIVDLLPTAAQIIPTINGVETSEIQVDVLTTAQLVEGRYTVNAGDVPTAAARLAASKVDTEIINIDESLKGTSSAVITDFYIVFLANIAVVEVAYNSGTKTATGTLVTNETVADYITAQVAFEFTAAQNVKVVELKLLPYSDGTTDKNLARFKIVGYA